MHVTITRTDEYIIEIDEEIYGKPEWQQEFSRYFHNIDGDDWAEDIAKDLAYAEMQDVGRFIEGYGRVPRDGSRGYDSEDFRNGKQLPDNELPEFAPGLNICVISTNDFDYEVKEANHD
jgi:hypothetical protein